MERSKSAVRRIGKQSEQPISDPVRLARNILLLPRGRAQLELVLFLRQLADAENAERFILSSPPRKIPQAFVGIAHVFCALAVPQRRWVLSLVDSVGKSEASDLTNAGYGGYPLFSEWAEAVRRAQAQERESIAPDADYGLFGYLGEEAYIDLIETVRLYEVLYLDALDTLKIEESSAVPPLEEVCFGERIPILAPDVVKGPQAEKRLSTVTGGFADANTAMYEILAPAIPDTVKYSHSIKISTGVRSYENVIIQTKILLDVLYNLLETLNKKPRALPETPSSEQEIQALVEKSRLEESAITALARFGIPAEACRAFLQFCEKEGAEAAVKRLRTDIEANLSDTRKEPSAGAEVSIDDHSEVTEENDVQHVEGRTTWMQRYKEARVVSPNEFKNSRKTLLETAQNGSWLLIKRQKTELAFLGPLDRQALRITRTVSPLELKSGAIFDEVKAGERMIVERKGEKVAVLLPPPPPDIMALTQDELAKMEATAGLSVAEVETMVAFTRGEITALDIVRSKTKGTDKN